MPQVLWRPVYSRGLRPDWDIVVAEVAAAIDKEVKPALLNYFNKIVASWSPEDAPQFKAKKHIDKHGIVIYVYPTGTEHQKDVWKWVSITGTIEHPIEAINAPYLKYRKDYLPRTTRSGGYKGPGAAVGPWRTALIVIHPGFMPRDFEGWVHRWYEDTFRKVVEAAFRRGIYRATHV